ncbi:hypothetical protein [Geomicrobium sp. JCM 19055]|uniref:hypothetical protein n=1 Tax=Geomicrobium sp. JCM 19055 TaxID=1460649 RepID=UPI00045EDB04|nr:hypothetical protein [Geomicrobium sp. JCM 19055]GAJ99813.1 hypothetical protein JCM19055_2856 [Geomicrobium sp. JCM 19055]
MNVSISIVDEISQSTEENAPGVSAIEVEMYFKSLEEYKVIMLWDIACTDLIGSCWKCCNDYLPRVKHTVFTSFMLQTIECSDVE